LSRVEPSDPSIGVAGALSIGIGGIVGGGFFATFGMTIAGAGGATPIAFLLAGIIALMTAYSYIGLTLTYPGPGGTVSFIRQAFGGGFAAASINVLLILSYVSVMAVYAAALASYTAPYLPADLRDPAQHVIASLTVVALGLVNFAGAGLMERLETVFNAGKLGILAVFILAGFAIGELDWSRLGPAHWAPLPAIVASGMLGFLAYEGFELIANASGDIKDPKRTIPIAYLGSISAAIVIYLLAFVVAIGHLPFEDIAKARDFAVSAAAGTFLGPFGFGLMAAGAVLASASAINADYFGAAKLPVMLASDEELPSFFQRSIRGKSAASLLTIGVLALAAINFLSIQAISAATSAGFLIVFAAVNLAAARLSAHTGARTRVCVFAAALCIGSLLVMLHQFLSEPATRSSAYAVLGLAALACAIEAAYRVAARFRR